MTYCHPVLDGQLKAVGDMQHAAVLNIGPMTYINGIDIAPDYRVEPDTGVGAHFHIADNHRIGRDESAFVDAWGGLVKSV